MGRSKKQKRQRGPMLHKKIIDCCTETAEDGQPICTESQQPTDAAGSLPIADEQTLRSSTSSTSTIPPDEESGVSDQNVNALQSPPFQLAYVKSSSLTEQTPHDADEILGSLSKSMPPPDETEILELSGNIAPPPLADDQQMIGPSFACMALSKKDLMYAGQFASAGLASPVISQHVLQTLSAPTPPLDSGAKEQSSNIQPPLIADDQQISGRLFGQSVNSAPPSSSEQEQFGNATPPFSAGDQQNMRSSLTSPLKKDTSNQPNVIPPLQSSDDWQIFWPLCASPQPPNVKTVTLQQLANDASSSTIEHTPSVADEQILALASSSTSMQPSGKETGVSQLSVNITPLSHNDDQQMMSPSFASTSLSNEDLGSASHFTSPSPVVDQLFSSTSRSDKNNEAPTQDLNFVSALLTKDSQISGCSIAFPLPHKETTATQEPSVVVALPHVAEQQISVSLISTLRTPTKFKDIKNCPSAGSLIETQNCNKTVSAVTFESTSNNVVLYNVTEPTNENSECYEVIKTVADVHMVNLDTSPSILQKSITSCPKPTIQVVKRNSKQFQKNLDKIDIFDQGTSTHSHETGQSPIIIQDQQIYRSTNQQESVIVPLDEELLNALNLKDTDNIPVLNLSLSDLPSSIQFDASRCSHVFSGISSNVSRFDVDIERGNVLEVSQDVSAMGNNLINSSISSHNTNETESLISIVVDNDSIPVLSSSATTDTENNRKGRPKRGRKRKYAQQNRAEKKRKLNMGRAYINYKGITVPKKSFQGTGFDCKCNKKCTTKLPERERRNLFETYWSAGSYEARCAILQGSCKEIPKKRSYRGTSKKRVFTREYTLNGFSVCKKTYLNTFAISQKPLDIALTKKRQEEPLIDKRGQKGGINKLPQERVEEIVSFIKKLPKYKSHYCRNDTTSKYLAPNLNLSKLYDLYKEEYNTTTVSKSSFKKVFYTKFNLKFKKPQKDTCVKCDIYKAQIKNAVGAELEELEKKHIEHLHKAGVLRDKMKSDIQLAVSDDSVETITFDLEKTHCLPRLPSNIVYYKRQLNLYNFGIHQASNNKGYFNVWIEYEAGRGTQEVGSCIKKWIKENLKPTAKKLILWSDSCGGQNKSIKLVLQMQHLLQNHETLERIKLRFLFPGHTYLPNDSDFGDVECALKTHPRLYTDKDYINVMELCRRSNKFIINRLNKHDFFSVEPLLKAITNRKFDINKRKISWLDTFEIGLKKEHPFKMFFKTDINSTDVQVVNISKAGKTAEEFKEMVPPILYPNGKELSSAKIKDLKEMLKLIPKDAKPFYNFLKNRNGLDFTDDIDGFGDTVDFNVLQYEDSDGDQ